MNEQPEFTTSPFDAIRKTDEQGNEYWSARDLYQLLGYSRWEKFQHAIEQGKSACEQSNQLVSDHFHLKVKMIRVGKGAQRKMEDYHLSRYGCYLLVQNSDPTGKPIVALGQAYFAIQTRRQELADDQMFIGLSNDEKRLVYRREMAVLNQQLAAVAKISGVIKPEHFAIFNNRGYQGLYNGETENMIHTRKGLQANERILDFMGSDELAANIFRASLTRQRLEREQTQGRETANATHYQVGKRVRDLIIEQGGTVPEQLPTPEKSFGQLEREEQMRIAQSQQPPLFPFVDEQD